MSIEKFKTLHTFISNLNDDDIVRGNINKDESPEILFPKKQSDSSKLDTAAATYLYVRTGFFGKLWQIIFSGSEGATQRRKEAKAVITEATSNLTNIREDNEIITKIRKLTEDTSKDFDTAQLKKLFNLLSIQVIDHPDYTNNSESSANQKINIELNSQDSSREEVPDWLKSASEAVLKDDRNNGSVNISKNVSTGLSQNTSNVEEANIFKDSAKINENPNPDIPESSNQKSVNVNIETDATTQELSPTNITESVKPPPKKNELIDYEKIKNEVINDINGNWIIIKNLSITSASSRPMGKMIADAYLVPVNQSSSKNLFSEKPIENEPNLFGGMHVDKYANEENNHSFIKYIMSNPTDVERENPTQYKQKLKEIYQQGFEKIMTKNPALTSIAMSPVAKTSALLNQIEAQAFAEAVLSFQLKNPSIKVLLLVDAQAAKNRILKEYEALPQPSSSM